MGHPIPNTIPDNMLNVAHMPFGNEEFVEQSQCLRAGKAKKDFRLLDQVEVVTVSTLISQVKVQKVYFFWISII